MKSFFIQYLKLFQSLLIESGSEWKALLGHGSSAYDSDHNYTEVEDESEANKKLHQRLMYTRKKKTAIFVLFMFGLTWRLMKKKRNRDDSSAHLSMVGLIKNMINYRQPNGNDGRKKRVIKDDYRKAIEAPISVLLTASKKGMIKKALINNGMIAYQLGDNSSKMSSPLDSVGSNIATTWKRTMLPKDNPSLSKKLMNDISNGGCLDISILPEPLISRLIPMIVNAIPFMYLICLYHMLKRLQKGSGGDDLNGTITELKGEERITFADVAGIDTAQAELQEIVSYLSNPKPFLNVGASPPCGLLLFGKPGLGKTLLARAVAGEANADYFVSCSGSDFVEIYVGQGSKRVRSLFSNARNEAAKKWRRKHNKGRGINMITDMWKKSSPWKDDSSIQPPTAVIFIDEIDAVAKCRDGIGRGMLHSEGGSNDEREQTLNALLAEMDGFTQSDVLTIVIAATNRVSILDPAILRPGRFDRHVGLSSPNSKGREAILKVHSRKKKFEDDVDMNILAKDDFTHDFSGAELRNVVNEAALLAVRGNCSSIGQHHLYLAVKRIKKMKRYSNDTYS